MPKNLRTPEQILRHAKRLDPSDIFDLAWKLMDLAGIVLFAGVTVDDIREDMEDEEHELHGVEVTDEQILEAITEAAEGDYSEWSTEAKDAAVNHLRKALGLDGDDADGDDGDDGEEGGDDEDLDLEEFAVVTARIIGSPELKLSNRFQRFLVRTHGSHTPNQAADAWLASEND